VDAELAQFVAARWPALLRFGVVLTGSGPDAEDLVQAALARTAARWRSVRSRDHPEAYVRQAMVRLHVNRRRGLLWRERPVSDVPDWGVEAAGIEAVPVRLAVWAALGTLPARQRAVLVLRYYEDLSEVEISRVLGCSPGTVKSQAAKALRALRTLTGLADDAPAAADGRRT
jgi:RNA polymerase sigma-70 factor (sigma-E family)